MILINVWWVKNTIDDDAIAFEEVVIPIFEVFIMLQKLLTITYNIKRTEAVNII